MDVSKTNEIILHNFQGTANILNKRQKKVNTTCDWLTELVTEGLSDLVTNSDCVT